MRTLGRIHSGAPEIRRTGREVGGAGRQRDGARRRPHPANRSMVGLPIVHDEGWRRGRILPLQVGEGWTNWISIPVQEHLSFFS